MSKSKPGTPVDKPSGRKRRNRSISTGNSESSSTQDPPESKRRTLRT